MNISEISVSPTTYRPAKFTDIPALLDLMTVAHFASSYAGKCRIDTAHAEKVLRSCIGNQGTEPREGQTLVYVAESDGLVVGAIIGILQRVYLVTDVLEATDLFWFARPGADPSVGPKLMRYLHKWASKIEHVIEIVQANRDTISDPDRTGKLIERTGARMVGHVYIKETGR